MHPKSQSIFFFTILAFLAISPILAVDLLGGKGSFTPSNIATWTQKNDHSTAMTFSSQTLDGFQLVQVDKGDATTNFKDGLYKTFAANQPQHVSFYFASSNVELEDTNLRLNDDTSGKSALSFRCGRAGFVRVNENQIVSFYNSTVSTTTNIMWNKADLVLDWSAKKVNIYLNSSLAGTANFYYTDVSSVSSVQIYNLNGQTTSFFRDLEVCDTFCNGFSFGSILEYSLAALVFSFLAFL